MSRHWSPVFTSLGSCANPLLSSVRRLPQLHRTSLRNITLQPNAGFEPERVAVVLKTTRYEFELQRYRYAGLSEDHLKRRLAEKGSSYGGLLERHDVHTRNAGRVVEALQRDGVEVRVVRRGEYDRDTVRWADAVVSVGGDGTMLLAAAKVFGEDDKPVIGVNTDPEKSRGHLCLPVRYTHAFPEALRKLRRGDFEWLSRQRSRIYLEGSGIEPVVPVDLHDMQLSLERRNAPSDVGGQFAGVTQDGCGPDEPVLLLPVRSLNEVFIGESLSTVASYYEISVDDGPWEKQKSSGLSVSTGTGSTAWSYNINRLGERAVEDVLRLASQSGDGLDIPLDRYFVERITKRHNKSLVFGPGDGRLLFSVREPIVNRVFSCGRPRGFARKVRVRSRCWHGCMVVDSATSFPFDDGAVATITTSEEDVLRTVTLDRFIENIP